MISETDCAYIAEYAFVPEHLPDYVCAISQTEPFLINNFVIYVGATHLIFIGYPLHEDWVESKMLTVLDEVKARFNPVITSIIAPELPEALDGYSQSPPDAYYRLDLDQLVIPKKTRNMLRRARREVAISTGNFSKEHEKIVENFIRRFRVDKATRNIFQRLDKYAKCDTTAVYDARNTRGELVAFDIAEFGARGYAFYMFNFRSHKHNVPGVSDLLLAHIIERAQTEGKVFLNLGLGINAGIVFFKKKFGAEPFLKHTAWTQDSLNHNSWWATLDQIAK